MYSWADLPWRYTLHVERTYSSQQQPILNTVLVSQIGLITMITLNCVSLDADINLALIHVFVSICMSDKPVLWLVLITPYTFGEIPVLKFQYPHPHPPPPTQKKTQEKCSKNDLFSLFSVYFRIKIAVRYTYLWALWVFICTQQWEKTDKLIKLPGLGL